MDIQAALLCDAAADYNGKLNVLGTFDTICASQFPAFHAQCAIALRLVFHKPEEGRHEVTLSFVDEDGKQIMPGIEMPLEIAIPDDSIFISRNLVLTLQQLRFEKAGLYSIDIALDRRRSGSIPLLVKQMTGGPGNS
jgi:hypothetical protein